MVATYLSYKDWNDILKPLLPALLNALGIARSFSRPLLFTPVRLQGIGLFHPFFIQHLSQLEPLLGETYSLSNLGTSINGAAEEVCREAGWYGTLGNIPLAVLEAVVTPSWLRSLLMFCQKYQIHIDDPLPPLQPPRAQDRLLMPIWVDLGYTESQLHNLRSCMLHKDAMWLSDLTGTSGSCIFQDSYSSMPLFA